MSFTKPLTEKHAEVLEFVRCQTGLDFIGSAKSKPHIIEIELNNYCCSMFYSDTRIRQLGYLEKYGKFKVTQGRWGCINLILPKSKFYKTHQGFCRQ